MGGVDFSGEAGVAEVLKGGAKDDNDLFSCSHYAVKHVPAGGSAGAAPHSDAAGQDSLNYASEEGADNGGRGPGSSDIAEEVEVLLSLLRQ